MHSSDRSRDISVHVCSWSVRTCLLVAILQTSACKGNAFRVDDVSRESPGAINTDTTLFDDIERRGTPSFRLGRRSSSDQLMKTKEDDGSSFGSSWSMIDEDGQRIDELLRSSPSFRLGKRSISDPSGDDVNETGRWQVPLLISESSSESSSESGRHSGRDGLLSSDGEIVTVSTRSSPSFRLGKRLEPAFRLGKREPTFRLGRSSPSFRLGKRAASEPTFRLGRRSADQPVIMLPYYFRDLAENLDNSNFNEEIARGMHRSAVGADDVTADLSSADETAERQLKLSAQKRPQPSFRLGKRDSSR